MWITVYCDASFKNNTTGWGCWIKSSQERIIKSGTSKDPICSVSSEMFAVLKSIQLVLKHHEDVTGIFINSDCLSVVQQLNFKNHHKKTKNIKINEYKEQILKLIKEKSIKIKTKHVKGHQPNYNVRNYLNNQVDKISKLPNKKGI